MLYSPYLSTSGIPSPIHVYVQIIMCLQHNVSSAWGVTNAQNTREVAQLLREPHMLIDLKRSTRDLLLFLLLVVQPNSPDGDAKKDDVANFLSST